MKPKRPSEPELRKVQVTVLQHDPLMLRCKKCGAEWRPGHPLPEGYWRCPKDCSPELPF